MKMNLVVQNDVHHISALILIIVLEYHNMIDYP